MEFRAPPLAPRMTRNGISKLQTRFSRNMIFQNGTQHNSNNFQYFNRVFSQIIIIIFPFLPSEKILKKRVFLGFTVVLLSKSESVKIY